MGNRRHLCVHLPECFLWICRIWGIMTAIGLWGTGIETLFRKHLLGIYLLGIAVLVSICESVFVIRFWVIYNAREENTGCVRCWTRMLWLDDWRKGILYFLLSAVCFVQPHSVWLAMVSGVMLIICGLLYCSKTATVRQDVATDEVDKNHQTYGRFDEVQEDIEENLTSTLEIEEPTVADQDEIMDV